ncbi:MAG: beta-ketoacyl-ACP synthase III [Candidatus Aerophobetes bacterium]|nr:beta-ketoacyl-ACP synthase III [Candidatus Aerophobetes bacterium]
MKLNETQIIGTGSYLPRRILTNADLENMIDTSDEWIRARTGIKERRIADKKEAASDLAYKASIKAMEAAKIIPQELDMIIVATITPDMIFPATACILQEKLGAQKIVGFDLEAACSGFLYGLSVASQFIATGMYNTILVVAAETLSRITDWKDRNTCVLFADGAGAAILRPSHGSSRIISSYLEVDGSGADLVKVPAGGSRFPASIETVKNREHYMKMKGNELFKKAVKMMAQTIEMSLNRGNLTVEDVNLFIPHQANIRIIQAVTKRVGLSMDKTCINLDRYGNLSAASIAVALDERVREGKIKRGDKILFTTFGGGITAGSILLEW